MKLVNIQNCGVDEQYLILWSPYGHLARFNRYVFSGGTLAISDVWHKNNIDLTNTNNVL